MRGLSHILVTLALGLDTGKRSTLRWFENQWANRTTLRYLNFTCEECECICLLSTQSWGEADWNSRRLWLVSLQLPRCRPQPEPGAHCSPACFAVWLHTRVGSGWGELSCEEWSSSDHTWNGIWTVRRETLLTFMEAVYSEQFRTGTGARTTAAPALTHTEHLLQPLLFQHHLLLGGRGPCWERETAYILEQSQLSPTLMTSVSATWDLLLPPAGWCWPLSRGETLALDLVPQSSGHVLPRW